MSKFFAFSTVNIIINLLLMLLTSKNKFFLLPRKTFELNFFLVHLIFIGSFTSSGIVNFFIGIYLSKWKKKLHLTTFSIFLFRKLVPIQLFVVILQQNF